MCMNCQGAIQPGWKHCPECGQDLQQKYCTKCGNKLDSSWKISLPNVVPDQVRTKP